MNLRDHIDYSAFLRTVHQCRGEVLLVTPEGDRLNLKSTLSQFVFAAAITGRLCLSEASLVLEDGADAAVLKDFLTGEE